MFRSIVLLLLLLASGCASCRPAPAPQVFHVFHADYGTDTKNWVGEKPDFSGTVSVGYRFEWKR